MRVGVGISLVQGHHQLNNIQSPKLGQAASRNSRQPCKTILDSRAAGEREHGKGKSSTVQVMTAQLKFLFALTSNFSEW